MNSEADGVETDWVQDVRRWALDRAPALDRRSEPTDPPDDDDALGYEAANPPLQAVNWPDAGVD